MFCTPTNQRDDHSLLYFGVAVECCGNGAASAGWLIQELHFYIRRTSTDDGSTATATGIPVGIPCLAHCASYAELMYRSLAESVIMSARFSFNWFHPLTRPPLSNIARLFLSFGGVLQQLLLLLMHYNIPDATNFPYHHSRALGISCPWCIIEIKCRDGRKLDCNPFHEDPRILFSRQLVNIFVLIIIHSISVRLSLTFISGDSS